MAKPHGYEVECVLKVTYRFVDETPEEAKERALELFQEDIDSLRDEIEDRGGIRVLRVVEGTGAIAEFVAKDDAELERLDELSGE